MNKQTKKSRRKPNWAEMRQQSKWLPSTRPHRGREGRREPYSNHCTCKCDLSTCNRCAMMVRIKRASQRSLSLSRVQLDPFGCQLFSGVAFDCFLFCICYSIRWYYGYLYSALTCVSSWNCMLNRPANHQPTGRLICQTFNLNWNHIISTIKLFSEWELRYGAVCFVLWQSNLSKFRKCCAHDSIHADMISIYGARIYMIYICNVLILMQDQLKIAWIYR